MDLELAIKRIRQAVEYAKYKQWDSIPGEERAQSIMDDFHNGAYSSKAGMWVQVNESIELIEYLSGKTDTLRVSVLDAIQESVVKLKKLNCNEDDLQITMSCFFKGKIENDLSYDYDRFMLRGDNNKILGVSVRFDHFDNEVVVYDKKRAGLDKKYKITIK